MQDDGWYARFPQSIRHFAVMDVAAPANDMLRWGQWANGPEQFDELWRYVEQETGED